MATYENSKGLAYPLTKMNFLVTVDGVSGTAAFSEVTGVEATVDVIEFRQGNANSLSPVKIPGLVKHGNVTLKFGYTLVRHLLDKDDVSRICAYNLMCRLLKRGEQLDMETLDKLLAVASVDIHTVDRQLLHSLINCLQCAEQINTEKALEVRQLLNNNGFDAF